jgi:MSHA biogenesis protein MshI
MYASRRVEIPLADLIADDGARRIEHFERIGLAVQRCLDYFEREYAYMPLAKLLVAPLPRDIGLYDYLAANVDGAVEAMDLAGVMDMSAVPDLAAPEHQSHYLSTIGAALRSDEASTA